MLIAHYIGDHAGETWSVRAGCALTRLVQKGEFSRVTHTEAILADWGRGLADIASSSLRDGGVRIKPRAQLKAGNWLVSDVPYWLEDFSRRWFEERLGLPYDVRGALATVLPGHHNSGEWFCSEAVGASVGLQDAHTFTPSLFAALCFSIGRDVTETFFRDVA